jgi:hypothetical protein
MSKKAPPLREAAAVSPAGHAVERQRREAVGQAVASPDDIERLSRGEREAFREADVEITEQRGAPSTISWLDSVPSRMSSSLC